MDVPTRISANLNECFDGCWFSGPSFLSSQHFESSGEDISTDGTNGNTVDEVNAEAVRVVGPTSCFSNTTQEKTSDDACSLNTVIDCTRFSTLKRLVSVTGYVTRFIGNIRKRLEKRTDIITDEVLTVEEHEEASSRSIAEEQLMIKEKPNYGNVRASLNLFDDKDGLLRLRGRFANSKLRYEQQQSFNQTNYLGCARSDDAPRRRVNFSVDPKEILDYQGKKDCKECLAKVCCM